MATLHEAKVLGYSTIFITKSGCSNRLVDLFLLAIDGVLERMETGVISKKKKKGQHLFRSSFCVTFRPKTAQIVHPNRF